MLLRGVLIAAFCSVAFSATCSAGEVVGRGDFEFFLDAAAFRMPVGTTRQDIYMRLPNTGVRFKEVSGRYEAKPRVSIRIRDAAGKIVLEDSDEFKMIVDTQKQATNPTWFHTLTKSYTLDEGVYTLSCVIEDWNSPKVTMMAMVKNKYSKSVINGYPLDVPTFPQDKVSVSDPKYLWKAGRPGDESTYVANPSRMYGLYRDSVSVFVEAYVPRSGTYQDLEIRTVILDDAGEAVKESSVIIPAAATSASGDSLSDVATYPILITEDLNLFPAGKYTLYVSAGARDELLVRRLAGSFHVAWDMRTWEVARRNLIAEAKFLLDDKDLKGFVNKSIGEQEAIVRAMWQEIDPDPATGVNEAHEKYMERLAYVEARYADYELGVYSDRGLIFLKYGMPDEKIVDVIPLNRESMSDALQKVEDRFHAVNFSNTGGRLGYARPQQSIIVDPRRLGAVGEGGEVAFPYELWVYNQSGDPIRKRDKILEPGHGLRFIFIDREGYGRYRLESSSSMANK
jgi:GWxTD domain-containing protein